MRIGTLNREVTIQMKSVTQDPEFGTEVITWVPLSILPGSPEVAERFAAEVMDLQPGQSEGVVRGDLAIARNLTRVRIRWRNDIDATMRVILHGDTDRVMEIVGGPAEFGGRKVGLEMMCEKATS